MPTNASPLASKRPPDKSVSFGQLPKRKLDELMFVPEKDQSKDIRDALFRYTMHSHARIVGQPALPQQSLQVRAERWRLGAPAHARTQHTRCECSQ